MSTLKPNYQICLQIKRATGLLPPQGEDTLNPYLVFQLQGSTESQKTRVLQNTFEPIYNQILILNGYYVGSDCLNAFVKNKNDDEIVGVGQIDICRFLLGEVQNYTMNLYKYDSKTKGILQGSAPGDAGQIITQVHIAKLDDTPFVSNIWKYPLYNAWIEFLDATDCSTSSNKLPNPFVRTTISPCLNNQTFQTKAIENTSNPVWNEKECILLDNFREQVINITLASQYGNREKPIGEYKCPLRNFKVGTSYEQTVQIESAVNKQPVSLHFRIQITAKDTEPFRFNRSPGLYSNRGEQLIRDYEQQQLAEKARLQQLEEQSRIQSQMRQRSVRVENATWQEIIETIEIRRTVVTRKKIRRQDIVEGISDRPGKLNITVYEATNMTNAQSAYMLFYIKSDQKHTTAQTQVVKNNNKLSWDEELNISTKALLVDTLVVNMYNAENHQIMDTIEIPTSNLPLGAAYVFNRDIRLNNSIIGHLKFSINTKIKKNHCDFDWEDLKSSYSSSFEGASQEGHSISDHPSDENQTWHKHKHLKKVKDVKPKKKQTLSVTFNGVDNLKLIKKKVPVYIAVQRYRKSDPPLEVPQIIEDLTQSKTIPYFNVKSGNTIEVLVYQNPKGKAQLIGGQRFEVKNINLDGKTHSYNLIDGALLNSNDFDSNTPSVGTIKLAFKEDINYK